MENKENKKDLARLAYLNNLIDTGDNDSEDYYEAIALVKKLNTCDAAGKESISERILLVLITFLWNGFPALGLFCIMDSLKAPRYISILAGVLAFMLFVVIDKLNEILHKFEEK